MTNTTRSSDREKDKVEVWHGPRLGKVGQGPLVVVWQDPLVVIAR